MVDGIVLLIIIFFALVGLYKGFWRHAFELMITAVSLAVAWIYYQLSQQIFKSLLVFVWVFLGLTVLKWFLLRMRKKRRISGANRLWGATLGLIWGIFIASFIILALELLPSELLFRYNIKQQVQQSRAGKIVHRLIPIKNLAIVENLSYISKIGLDEQAQLRLLEQAEFQELLQHESLKEIMQDPELINQLENQDLPNLLTHPKILRLLNDGSFIDKLLQVDFKKVQEN